MEPGRALSAWKDGGWGELVRRGKYDDERFDEALVGAATALVRTRWRPAPAPTWVTCVPSRSRPGLVPDFARRLAGVLGLPFHPCVEKVGETRPQKKMENSVQQLRSLAGAFRVAAPPDASGPVLLVDDAVDSRWTLTVLGALLRRAGSGPVFPLALTDTSRA